MAKISLKATKAELNEQDVQSVFEALPPEGALAMEAVVQRMFPKAEMKTTIEEGIFGGRIVSRPKHISIPVSETETTNVRWGKWDVPELGGTLGMGAARGSFYIQGTVKTQHVELFKQLEKALTEELKTTRLYKGRAVKVDFVNSGGVPSTLPPVKLTGITPDMLILNRDVQDDIEASVYAVIEQTERLKELGIPRKRGILLEGTYGVGKTLMSAILAKKAVDNGWTYLLVDSSESLSHAFQLAKRYGRTVIQVEDLDQIASQNRDDINEILNPIDDVEAKNEEILIVATTNFVERIDPAFLRPGRFDHVIHVAVPDADTRNRMVKHFAGKSLPKGVSFGDTIEELEGATPAMVRETVERAKLRMLTKGRKQLDADTLFDAAKSLRRQRELTTPRVPVRQPMEQFGAEFGRVVNVGIKDAVRSAF